MAKLLDETHDSQLNGAELRSVPLEIGYLVNEMPVATDRFLDEADEQMPSSCPLTLICLFVCPACVCCCSSAGFSLCLSWFPVYIVPGCIGPAGVCCSAVLDSSCVSGWFPVYCSWQCRSC